MESITVQVSAPHIIPPSRERDSIRCELTNKLLGRIDHENNLYYWCDACHCLHQLRLDEIVKRQGDMLIDGRYGK